MPYRIASVALFVVLFAACSAGDPSSAEPLPPSCPGCAPDLVVDAQVLAGNILQRELDFAADSCEAEAGCAGAGRRNVLLLASAIRNDGDAPLRLGAGSFSEARCGGGTALSDFLQWRIVGADGATLREGFSDLGCIADGRPAIASEGQGTNRFSCGAEQGLQPGWVDDAPSEGGCTFADLTGLEPGEYELELVVNPHGTIPEKRSDNNMGRAAFRIDGASCAGEICGMICCPDGIGCVDGKCALPDLIIDEDALLQSIRIDEANFAGDDCAVEEGCVEATGLRRLLRFTLATANAGGADLLIGDPGESEEAEWSTCHEHFHMMEFANYRLLRADGSVAATGHKQAFCLMDTAPHGNEGPTSPQYDCDFQGISRGWSDSYGSGLDCQWVDVTGVPEGAYFLDVEVNGAKRYPELDYQNNSLRVPVYLPADPSQCVPRDEVCGDGRDQNCDGVPDDGCPPLTGNDSCGAAWHLDGSGTWTGAIGASTVRDGGGSCGGAGGGLHFSLQVLSEEIVYLSTYGSDIDTVLRLDEGRCGAKSEVACTDEGCGGAQSHFVGALQPGSYDVVVQARAADATGMVKLNVQRSGCSGARPIGEPGSYAGDTVLAGRATRTSCGLGGGPDELWYFATCPGETEVDISTCDEGSFDTVLELRRASCRGLAVACNDDNFGGSGCIGGSQIAEPLTGEGLWFVVVDGYLSGDGGPYRLDVVF